MKVKSNKSERKRSWSDSSTSASLIQQPRIYLKVKLKEREDYIEVTITVAHVSSCSVSIQGLGGPVFVPSDYK